MQLFDGGLILDFLLDKFLLLSLTSCFLLVDEVLKCVWYKLFIGAVRSETKSKQ